MTLLEGDLIVDPFAGPGGWSDGLRLLGLTDIGFEWDAAACATRAAAGHATVRADVAQVALEPLIGKVRGLIASPPCQLFSTAGRKAGRGAIELLAAGMRDLAAGEDTRAQVRIEAAAVIAAGLKADILDGPNPPLPGVAAALQQVDDDAARLAYNACLVLEPARWAFTLEPEWIACEQVPAVLPLWHELASLLRAKGYRTWTGILNAADYGVPQTRKRAILMAHRSRPVAAPEPTHSERPEATLFSSALQPWVTMAAALGWAEDGRVGFPRLDDKGTSEDGYRDRDWTPTGEPAPTVTKRTRSWQLQPGGWQAGTARRRYDVAGEPAPTLAFGNDAIGWRWFEVDEPEEASPERALVNTGRDWPANGDRADGYRVTIPEASVLQSFHPRYPWQGSHTKQYEQIGNAVPVLLAAHVVAALALDE